MRIRRATTARTIGRMKEFGKKKTLIRETPTAPTSRPFLSAVDRTEVATVSTRDAVALPLCELVMRADLSATKSNSCFLLRPDNCLAAARLKESLPPCATYDLANTSAKTDVREHGVDITWAIVQLACRIQLRGASTYEPTVDGC